MSHWIPPFQMGGKCEQVSVVQLECRMHGWIQLYLFSFMRGRAEICALLLISIVFFCRFCEKFKWWINAFHDETHYFLERKKNSKWIHDVFGENFINVESKNANKPLVPDSKNEMLSDYILNWFECWSEHFSHTIFALVQYYEARLDFGKIVL